MTTTELNARTNALFWARTGYKPGSVLDPGDPADREMMKVWRGIRAELEASSASSASSTSPATPEATVVKASRVPLYLALALVGTTAIIAVQNRRRIRRAAEVTATGARRVAAGVRIAADRARTVTRAARRKGGEIADQVKQLVRAHPEDERTFMEKYGDQYRAKHGSRARLALPPGGAA